MNGRTQVEGVDNRALWRMWECAHCREMK